MLLELASRVQARYDTVVHFPYREPRFLPLFFSFLFLFSFFPSSKTIIVQIRLCNVARPRLPILLAMFSRKLQPSGPGEGEDLETNYSSMAPFVGRSACPSDRKR